MLTRFCYRKSCSKIKMATRSMVNKVCIFLHLCDRTVPRTYAMFASKNRQQELRRTRHFYSQHIPIARIISQWGSLQLRHFLEVFMSNVELVFVTATIKWTALQFYLCYSIMPLRTDQLTILFIAVSSGSWACPIEGIHTTVHKG